VQRQVAHQGKAAGHSTSRVRTAQQAQGGKGQGRAARRTAAWLLALTRTAAQGQTASQQYVCRGTVATETTDHFICQLLSMGLVLGLSICTSGIWPVQKGRL
jgi:hypothetical protein